MLEHFPNVNYCSYVLEIQNLYIYFQPFDGSFAISLELIYFIKFHILAYLAPIFFPPFFLLPRTGFHNYCSQIGKVTFFDGMVQIALHYTDNDIRGFPSVARAKKGVFTILLIVMLSVFGQLSVCLKILTMYPCFFVVPEILSNHTSNYWDWLGSR